MDEITVIKPSKGLHFIDLKELYRYRDLFWTLAEKDIKVRYKQTVIGGLWAVLQPFLTMVVFTIFLGNIAKIPSEGVPYAIFSYSGLILWNYFSNALNNASNSLIGNESLVSKVYFPRVIIPLSATLVGLLDYGIALVIYFGLMAYYKISPTVNLLLIPELVFLTWLLASGLGVWLAAINVKYRDVRYAVPFFIQLLLFMTPIIYPFSLAGNYRWLLALNPLSGFIDGHRSALIAHQPLNLELLGLSIILTFLIFLGGNLYFKSVERYFADVI